MIKFVCNMFNNEMLAPFQHMGTELLKYLCQFCQNIIEMLEIIKKEQQSSLSSESSRKPLILVENSEEEKSPIGAKYPFAKNAVLLDKTLVKEYWFLKLSNFDIEPIGSIFSYAIQVRLAKKIE